MQKISLFLWFEHNALEAAHFYTSLFPGSRIDKVTHAPVDTPSLKTGEVMLVSFTLAGQQYQAMNGGKHEPFNDSMSLSVMCEDQGEVDRLWAALTADGGRPVMCGWLKDRYGIAWQITPRRLIELVTDPDAERARRAMTAMFGMVKIDIAGLEAAADGR